MVIGDTPCVLGRICLVVDVACVPRPVANHRLRVLYRLFFDSFNFRFDSRFGFILRDDFGLARQVKLGEHLNYGVVRGPGGVQGVEDPQLVHSELVKARLGETVAPVLASVVPEFGLFNRNKYLGA